jgi:hypothetical protein
MKLTHTLLALAAATSVGLAHADQFEVFTYSGSSNFTTAAANTGLGASYTSVVGWQVGATTGFVVDPLVVMNYSSQSSFIAFCIQPGTALSTAAAYDAGVTTQTYTSTTAGVDASVQKLFDLYGPQVTLALKPWVNAPSNGQGALYAGAMQLAIWNLMYDNDFTLSSGNVKLVFPSVGNYANLLALGNTMLAGVQNLPTPTTHKLTTIWNSNGSQNLIQSAAVVPEPSAYALIAAGLGVVAFVQRRRLSKQA